MSEQDVVAHLDADTLVPTGVSKPCPSSAVAHLGASCPGGSRLLCGLLAGHAGAHVFHMEWTDPLYAEPSLGQRMAAARTPTRRPR